jgi:hypothetical protein
LSYEGDNYLNIKTIICIKIFVVINQFLKAALVSTHTRIQIYKILPRPTLSYARETWAIKRIDEKRLILAEMHLMIQTEGYISF